MREQLNRMQSNLLKDKNSIRANDEKFLSNFSAYLSKKGVNKSKEDLEIFRDILINQEYEIEFDNSLHLLMISEMRGFTNLLFGKKWKFWIAKDQKKFITSDNPVAEWFPPPRGFYGHSIDERRHFFPLSPDILVELADPSGSGKRSKKKEINDKEVWKHNINLARYSIRYCYSTNKIELQDIIDFSKNYNLYKIGKLNKILRRN